MRIQDKYLLPVDPNIPLPWGAKDFRRCTCRQLFIDCPYWRQVKTTLEAWGQMDDFDIASADHGKFARSNRALVLAMLRASGKHILCDSSKARPRLRQLLHSKGFRVTVVHLVRDGRAVAYSHARRIEGFPPGRAPDEFNYWKALTDWCRRTSGDEAFLRKLGVPVLFLRYEDLTQRPEESLTPILKKLGLRYEAGQLEFWKLPYHLAGGNRMRMNPKRGIIPDNEFLSGLSAKEWEKSTEMARDMLLRYGYPLRRDQAMAHRHQVKRL